MKKIHIIFVCIITMCMGACDDILDNIRDYLDEGETVYVGKMDSLSVWSGRNRVQVNGILHYGLTQTGCNIYWNGPGNVADSLTLSFTRIEEVDTFKYILEGLQQGQYDFTVKTFDSQGNESIPVTASAYVYGENFQESLYNRSMISFDGKTIVWKNLNDEGAIYTEVVYELRDGSSAVLQVGVEESRTQLSNLLPGSFVKWRSAYVPTITAIDTFYTAYNSVQAAADFVVELDKSLFSAVYLKNDTPMNEWNHSLAAIWNGNTHYGANTMCHSESTSGWPQWFTFDLGVTVQLYKYVDWQRLDDRYIYELGDAGNLRYWEVYGRADEPDPSGDWDGWIKLLDCERIKPSGRIDGETLTEEDKASATAGDEFFFSEDLPPVRYIRIKGVETFSGEEKIHIQQVSFWGEEAD